MANMDRAWLVLAAGDDRQHGSNDGYFDVPDHHYSWDDTVKNHDVIAIGDRLAIWDKRCLLGASVIEDIIVERADKLRRSCPQCGKASIKRRKTKLPVYRCFKCGAEFDKADERTEEVTTYRTVHDAGWVDLYGLIDAAALRQLCVSPRSQLSIRPLRWDAFSAAIGQCGPDISKGRLAARSATLQGGHRHTTVRVRVGQPQFRDALVRRHGLSCAFTGPTPEPALEACHLYSYAAVGEHHVEGGLLMRRDIHKLFDMGLLAIEPDTLTIDVSELLLGYPAYMTLAGTPLRAKVSSGHLRWIAAHWSLFRS